MADFAAALNGDAVIACADLVARSGATNFKLGYLHDDVPIEEAGWYAHAQYRGARITVDDRRSPSEAALALAERLLRGAACRCGKTVTLNDGGLGCRWQLQGKQWQPGCNEPALHVDGQRGDLGAIQVCPHHRDVVMTETTPSAHHGAPWAKARQYGHVPPAAWDDDQEPAEQPAAEPAHERIDPLVVLTGV